MLIGILSILILAAYLFKINYNSLQVKLGKIIWPQKVLINQIKDRKIDQKFQAFFDRDPIRKIPKESRIVTSPSDGIIENISLLIDNYYYIVVSLDLWDVHVQRVPIGGVIVEIKEEGTKDYRSITHDTYLGKSYQVVTTIKTEIGIVKVRQLTNIYAKRIQTFIKVGSKVKLGDKLGRILLGSTVVIELPNSVNLTNISKAKQRVVAGETIIARY